MRVDRSIMFMQVLWVGKEDICATWVQAKSLSPTVIEEFDKGFQSDVRIQEIAQGGQLSFTVEVQMNQIEGESPTKRQRLNAGLCPTPQGIILLNYRGTQLRTVNLPYMHTQCTCIGLLDNPTMTLYGVILKKTGTRG